MTTSDNTTLDTRDLDHSVQHIVTRNDSHPLQAVFRDALSSPGHRERAGWLTDWIKRSPSEAERIGLTYIGFGNTAARALGWHKVEKNNAFVPLGWELHPETLRRLRRAIDRCFEAYLSDTEASHGATVLLQSFNRAELTKYTAIDALFQSVTQRPIRTVLDYGSGIGRAALIWNFEREDTALVSVDATESLYLLQYELYRRLFGTRFTECLGADTPVAPLTAGAVSHVPAWTMDRAIPDASIDLIIGVQVLQEMPEPALRFALAQFRRVIRPQGLLYIRDKEFWTPEHRVRVGRALLEQGWHLAFRYPGNEGSDIKGVPRVWTFTGDDYGQYFTWRSRLKRVLMPSHPLSFGSWRDTGLPL